MDTDLQNLIINCIGAKEVTGLELIQKLWSGYGELSRVHTDQGSVILKLIEFPEGADHPRGWATDIGHQRKKKSYQVEKCWYQNFDLSVTHARMANGLSFGNMGEKQYLLLEDLKNSGFERNHHPSWKEVEQCLSWLAHFHNNFLGKRPSGLWEIGTYWHLDTRPEELEVLDDRELKNAASLIDKKLNEARFQTIVHGDAKLSNFLFNGNEAAAVDFQYVGGGIGVKDLAYFMSSIYEEDELEAKEEQCLDTYFRYLENPEVEKEWRELYPFAWCDFYRFLKGWSPGHWKINSYSEMMKERTLKCL